MLKAFFKDSAVYGLIRIVTSGTSVLLMPFYTRALSPADYGMVDFLTIFSNLVCLTVTLEIVQGFARYFADSGCKAQQIRYASTTLWFTVGAYSLFVIVAFYFSSGLSELLLDSSGHKSALQVAALAIWGHGLFYLVQTQLRYELQARRYAITSLAFSLASVGMTVVLLMVFRLGVIGVFFAQLSANMAGIVMGLYYTRHSYRWVFDWGKCQEMLWFSLPLCFSGLGVFASLYMDRIAIKHLMSMEDLGVYAVGYRIASFVILAMAGFQVALTPLIYQHYWKEQTPGEIERIFRWFLAIALPLVLLVGLFAGEALSVLAVSDYVAAHRVVFLLGVAFLFSNMYMFAPGVWIAKKTGWIAVINVVAAGLNLVLNYVLIPHFAILGAALATCISALVAFGGYIILGQNLYPIPYQWGKLVLVIAIVLALGAPTMQSGSFWTVTSGVWGLLLKSFALIAVSIALAILLLGRKEVIMSLELVRNCLKTFMPALATKTLS